MRDNAVIAVAGSIITPDDSRDTYVLARDEVAKSLEDRAAVVMIAPGIGLDDEYGCVSSVANMTYVDAVNSNGGTAVISLGKEMAKRYANMADGLIISGLLNYNVGDRKSELSLIRDSNDIALYKAFRALNKPVLGICQGHQIINICEGGTIKRNDSSVNHMMNEHMVRNKRDTIMYDLFGKEVMVNSRHNYIIDNLAERFTVSSVSDDGVIEAYEDKSGKVICVQWHPERMENMRRLFIYFMNMVK